MILVTGAAGKTGQAVIRALVARNMRVRGLVHRAATIATIEAFGAQAVVGDLGEANDLARAAGDATAIYHICPNVSPHEVAYGKAAIAAAKAAGVRRVVYHSVLHPGIEAMPHHWDKLRVEELLWESGLDVTILQPAAYMQNILAAWGDIVGQGLFRVPYPVATRLSLVDLDDVGEAAAIVLADHRHIGATYELSGTMPLSQDDVATTLSDALGRPVRAEDETIDAWVARATSLGGYQRETLIKMFRHYAAHGLVGNPTVLAALLGREPTSLAAFAAAQARV